MAKAPSITVNVTGTESFVKMAKMLSRAYVLIDEVGAKIKPSCDDFFSERIRWLDEYKKEYGEK